MIIYKIVNNRNKKVYIGQTIKTIEERYKEHYKTAYLKNSVAYDYYLYRAIRKELSVYPIITFDKFKEHFSIICLYVAKDKEDLNEKEKYYINKYNSINRSIGYNIASGGAFGKTEEINKKISLAQQGKKNHMYGKFGYNNPTSKPIKCLNDGKIFPSATEASKYYKCSLSELASVARGEKETIKGYKFEYIADGKKLLTYKYKEKDLKEDTSVINLYTKKVYNDFTKLCREFNLDVNYKKYLNKYGCLIREPDICCIKLKDYTENIDLNELKNYFYKNTCRYYIKNNNKYFKTLKELLTYLNINYDTERKKYENMFKQNSKINYQNYTIYKIKTRKSPKNKC